MNNAKWSLFMQEFGHLVWPVLLGFVGIYFLLPRPRRKWGIGGALLGAISLVALGWNLTALEAPLPEAVLFYAFAGTAILGGVLMIAQKNPVHAALSFALVVLSTCGLFLLQGAPFLMAATIVVYAGAIVVTFLFVIMLAQQAGTGDADQRSREPFLASLAGFVLVGAILCVLHRNYDTATIDKVLDQVNQLAGVKTADDIKSILGDPKAGVKSLPLADQLQGLFPDKFFNLEEAWAKGDVIRLKEIAADLREQCLALRAGKGGLLAAANLPLSTFSGQPASAAPTLTKEGKIAERLPARNVAALGKSLFTDYLIPVELAAMLLLVATIGAIAIVGRRAEVLR